jgi:hypothetical protein
MFPLRALPEEMQRLILGHLPLRDLARVACLSMDFRTSYWERVTQRDTVVADLLQSQFSAAFREGLTLADTALPRDLIVDSPVRRLNLRPLRTFTTLRLPCPALACFKFSRKTSPGHVSMMNQPINKVIIMLMHL